MQCPYCRGRLLMCRETGEEPYLKCLQCSRVAAGPPVAATPGTLVAEGKPVPSSRRHRANHQVSLAG